MQHEILLVAGLGIAILAIPSVISAWTDGRSPRIAAIACLLALVLVVVALRSWPGRFELDDLPRAVFSVVGLVIR